MRSESTPDAAYFTDRCQKLNGSDSWPCSLGIGHKGECVPQEPPVQTISESLAATCDHKWVPGGMVTMPYVEHSPVSRNDDYHGERVYQIALCEKCAATKHKLVAKR